MFTYDSLPDISNSSSHIRLLKIKPAIFLADILDCELISVPIVSPETPPFDALSYCWDLEPWCPETKCFPVREGEPRSIVVNGMQLPIQVNLHEALHRYRRLGCGIFTSSGGSRWNGKAEYIWADAICIDQSNTREKSTQVARMDQVYRRARRVFVNLGDVPDTWFPALELMVLIRSILGDGFYDAIQVDNYFAENRTLLFDQARVPPEGHPVWRELGYLFLMPWLNRTWVLQEMVLLVNRPVAMFGRFGFDLKLLLKPSLLLWYQDSPGLGSNKWGITHRHIEALARSCPSGLRGRDTIVRECFLASMRWGQVPGSPRPMRQRIRGTKFLASCPSYLQMRGSRRIILYR
ncbi:heterokaryon incompatibility protein-domain-containing protein [Podospora appendiculata]|uniref:Heterokaryon incompatibility protein-domain-containing protein n=1 Tax=Podospora appendiculata TaxID=314037 RepID=A0AAE0X1W7_9PEZI|nr:heterokaryon incompatibility protein-domain-containing protein [Podospora appendiculata]